MTSNATLAADALGAAIHARNTDGLIDLYADDIEVWHASTRKGMGKEENIGLLKGVFGLARELEYKAIRRYPIEDGLVQQHQLVGIFTDGTPMPTLEACLVLRVRVRQIIRIDEYFDSQSFAEVWKRLGA
jgi:ketosteroid isomerase-like protein